MSSPGADNTRRVWLNGVGFAILVLCYAAALWKIGRAKHEATTHDVIRIAHWQLELGVREGLDALIAKFEAQKAAEGHPVKVVQIPVTERAYGQYVTTQMVGGSPPDLIELNPFPREFFARYSLPLSKTIQQPNAMIARHLAEWEATTNLAPERAAYLPAYRELANRPWMDTFTDGLRQQYNEDLQEYFGVGFSQFTVRMFYNKNLYRRILGHDRAPDSYRRLLDDCERIRTYARQQGLTLSPIASSRYQVGMMQGRYLSSVTADAVRQFDRDYDGWSWSEELIAGMLTGAWSPDHPKYRAGIGLMLALADYFPRGFMAIDRMDAGFAFVQGRAAMITSGSWDARSFLKQIEDQPADQRFDVGVFSIPMLAPDDPEYGRYYAGAVSEANTGTGFAFGITRASPHPDLCIEFLQFCTTPEANTLLNQYAQWIPAVRGAVPTELLKAFEPSYVGYWGQMNFETGPRGRLVHEQVYWPLVSGEVDYPTYAKRLMAQLPAEAATDFGRAYTERGEAIPGGRARRSAYLALLTWGPPEEKPENAIKLLRAWDAIMGNEIGQHRLDALMRDVKAELADSGHTAPFNSVFFERLDREMKQRGAAAASP